MSELHASILKYVQQIVTLTSEEEAYFISLLRHRKLKRRQFLVQAGEVCGYEHFVVKGCLRAYYVDANAQEHVVQFAVENWWIGDLASFITGREASFYVEALEPSEVLLISKEDLTTLYQRVPKFERLFRILLQHAFVALQERTIQNLSMPAKERYERFMNKYPGMAARIALVHIASYLGMTPEFLSKIRREMLHT